MLKIKTHAEDVTATLLKNLDIHTYGFHLTAPGGDNGPYGDSVEPGQAPEAISKAVASLPPEQMFELMKQMKMCIQNNPQVRTAAIMLNDM